MIISNFSTRFLMQPQFSHGLFPMNFDIPSRFISIKVINWILCDILIHVEFYICHVRVMFSSQINNKHICQGTKIPSLAWSAAKSIICWKIFASEKFHWINNQIWYARHTRPHCNGIIKAYITSGGRMWWRSISIWNVYLICAQCDNEMWPFGNYLPLINLWFKLWFIASECNPPKAH